MTSSRDYEISHSTIQLELNSILETSTATATGTLEEQDVASKTTGTCKCLLAIQPFSNVTFIDLLLGSSQFMSSSNPSAGAQGTAVGGGSKDDSLTSNNRVKCVQLIAGLGSASEFTHQITDWTLDHQSNILHIPLSSSQSSSKQFHIVIWFELLNTNIVSSLSSSKDSVGPPSTPILLLDQHNMLNWFPCVVEDKYPMDWVISIPSHCHITGRKLVAICAGDLIGRYAHPYTPGQILYKYSCKIPLSPKSIVIAIGAFESVKINARSLGYGADLFGVGVDEVPDLLNVSSTNAASSRVKVFYPKEWDKDLVYSTCQYLPQALEFVEQWVGASFPFPSLKLVFSGTSSVPIISGATLIVVNIQLLVSDKDLDHVWFSRFYLCAAIAHQWFGHYIAKQSVDDLWIVIAFSRWIAYQFMKKVYGNNEVKFRLKKDMERLCIVDVKQPPLCPVDLPKTQEDLLVGHDLNPFEDSSSIRAELMNIKSALVFYMMEQRFGKGLLQKVASKIMMTHMSGELGSGLSTTLFLKLARKLSGKLEIKEFADQWIYRSGSPILSVRYTFNRKKMVIEVIVKQRSSNEGMVGANPKFTGPITIRVQEPAGTFDTEVRLEEYEKKYDIIYHTKYKRIRRTAKKSRKGDDDDDDDDEEEDGKDSNNLNSMQQQGEDSAELMAEPDRITFEWIRIDPDSLWVCHKSFEQEDFMWNALLRQDKDIISHYETVVALGKIPSGPTCSTLLGILKDPNYFYRVRMEAAFALTKFDSEELEYVGLTHLTKYFRDNYCMPSEKLMPERNNFEDLQSYYLKCALIMAIARFRDSKGWSPVSCRRMLIDLLRFNDNTGNKHSDSSWVCLLIDLIGDSFLPRPKNADDLSWCLTDRVHYKAVKEIRKEDIEEFDFPVEADLFSHRNAEIVKDHFEEEDHNLLELAVQEIMKALKHDRFAGSRNNGVTISCLEVLTKWQLAGLSALNISIFLYYSRHGHFPAIRKMAIEALIVLSGLEEENITRYLAYLCVNDPDPYIRYTTSMCLMHFIALACQQISTVAHPEAAKMTLKNQVTVLMDVWSPIAPERYDFHVFRYLAKLMDLATTLLPSEKSRFKYKFPRMATATIEALPPAPQPVLKPLKLSFKGIQPQVSPAKPAAIPGDKRMKALERLMLQKHAFWFLRPVDPVKDNLPHYFDSIRFPMDLGTVKRNLESGKYTGNKDFADDVRLTFMNAMKFNDPTLQVHVDAYSLSVQFESEFGSIMDDVLPLPAQPVPPEPTASKPPKAAPPAVNQMEGALKVLNKLLGSNHCALFQYPVDEDIYPDYFKIVANPIDLQTIKKRILTSEYQSFQDFHNDMQLLFTNCFTFNRKGTFGFAAGNEFQTLYQKLLKPYVKLLDPSTVKKVTPPSTMNPAAPSAVKVSTSSTPVTALPSPQTKAPSFNVRIPGKTGLTLRLPSRNAQTKPPLPTLVIKPLKPSPSSAAAPSPTTNTVPPSPRSATGPSPKSASFTIKFARPPAPPLNQAAAAPLPTAPIAPSYPQNVSSSSAPVQAAIPSFKFTIKAPKPPPAVPIIAPVVDKVKDETEPRATIAKPFRIKLLKPAQPPPKTD